MKSLQALTGNMTTRQRGGTFLGIIIGLVIGLGIAVAVAMVITKTSTPFTNKGAKAAETPPIQVSDPNKPLYGNKEAVKDAAKAVAEAAAQPRVAPGTEPTISDGVVTPAETIAPAKTENPDDNFVYFLQVGAFRNHADAEGAKAKMALSGFEAKITETLTDGSTLYRVRVGPFPQAELMNRNKVRLSENGVEATIIRNPKP